MSDLSTQLRNAIEAAAEPVSLDEILGDGAIRPLPSQRLRRLGHGRRIWWAAAAAVVVLVAGSVAFLDRPTDPHHTLQTPEGSVEADAFPAVGQTCGGTRVADGLQFVGPESADACIGLAPRQSDATTIYVTSADGIQIYGGWVLDSCASPLSASSQLEPGNEGSPVVKMGAVGADVAAVQYRLRDGTVLTVETGQIAEVPERRFYVVRVPANAPIADELLLASDGSEMEPPKERCQAPQLYLPDDAVVAMAASFVAESSSARGGLAVGDPCPSEGTIAAASTPMAALIDGTIDTPDCIVVGWTPHTDLPGIPMGYYGQDGTILWSGRTPGEAPPVDLRQRALDWAAAH
jgi:hypothetical protein